MSVSDKAAIVVPSSRTKAHCLAAELLTELSPGSPAREGGDNDGLNTVSLKS